LGLLVIEAESQPRSLLVAMRKSHRVITDDDGNSGAWVTVLPREQSQCAVGGY
jgi:hypothetical protein